MREPYIGQPYTRLSPKSTRTHIDSQPMRAHVETLRGYGMTSLMIARAAGTSESPLTRVLRGQQRVLSDVADAVMAVTPRPHPQQALVLSFSARRRVEGLMVMGWPLSRIATEMGVLHVVVWRMRNRPRMTWSSYRAVCDVFDRLSHVDGGDEGAKARAVGCVHPFLWDDIDDYFEVPSVPDDAGLPDPVVVERLIAGIPVTATAADKREALTVLVASGLSVSGAAARLGINHQTAVRYSELSKVAA